MSPAEEREEMEALALSVRNSGGAEAVLRRGQGGAGGAGLPSGAIIMSDDAGGCPAGFTEMASMAGRMPVGFDSAGGEFGGLGNTGGNKNIEIGTRSKRNILQYMDLDDEETWVPGDGSEENENTLYAGWDETVGFITDDNLGQPIDSLQINVFDDNGEKLDESDTYKPLPGGGTEGDWAVDNVQPHYLYGTHHNNSYHYTEKISLYSPYSVMNFCKKD